MSDNAERRTVAKASYGFVAGMLDPARVTHLLGLTPSSAHIRGELSPRTRTPWPWGVWWVEVVDVDVEPAAASLLSLLRPRRQAIATVISEMSATPSVRLWWEPEGGQGGYSLSATTTRGLAEFADRIDFSFV